MPNKREVREPFLFQLARQLLEADEDRPEGSDRLTDKELYSTFAFIVVAVAFFALTIGPFSLLK